MLQLLRKNKINRPLFAFFNVLRSRFFVLLLSACCFSFSFAESQNDSATLIEFLAQEKTNLTLSLNQLKNITLPESDSHYRSLVKLNEARLATVQAKIVSLENFLAEQQTKQKEANARLKRLQQSPLIKADQFNIQEKINKLNTVNEVNKKILELISDDLTLAKHYEAALQRQRNDLDAWKAKEESIANLKKLTITINSLIDRRNKLLQINANSQQSTDENVSLEGLLTLEARQLFNNQAILLIQNRISELELQKKIIQSNFRLLKAYDIKSVQSAINAYKSGLSQLDSMQSALLHMHQVLDDKASQLTAPALKKQYATLQASIMERVQHMDAFSASLHKQLDAKQQELKKQMALRQSLAEYHWNSLPALLIELTQLPVQFYNYLKILVLKVYDNYIWQELGSNALLLLALSFIVIISFILHRLLTKLVQEKERSRLAGHLYDWLLIIVRRNIPQLTVVCLMGTIFYFNNIALANYRLILNLLLVWLIFRNLILVARLTLLERISDASGKDVIFYYRLKWLFIAGGYSAGLMVISHQLPLSFLLQDMFSRIFMVFILFFSLVLWKSQDLIPHLLRPFLKGRKKYIRRAVGLMVFLIPLTLMLTAVIGLIGYINLAWSLSRYQVYILLVIIGFILLRGLLTDLLEILSEWMVNSLQNGWLWIEVILKPVDKIVRLVLLLLAGFILLQLLSWYSDVVIMNQFMEIGRYPLVNTSGIYITFFSISEFLILLFVFIWAAKWTREFSYRWLYRKTRDAGIRNSLSVFTQYAVILIGSFITLRALGLDFSGLSMILGGLAVGMGFGLRDFASNIVGGLMILIERPVREGDLITLGDYEGRVAHIGIRSMRVSSWDNMEVLIPNAETFNKPFTNWTHQDNVVRTVIPVKVNPTDDPFIIQRLILDVLEIIPEILPDPPPQVYLKQIDEALIEFEVRYFINVQLYTRFEVRSKVLFAINAQFKAAGIKPPIPPLSIELKQNESTTHLNERT